MGMEEKGSRKKEMGGKEEERRGGTHFVVLFLKAWRRRCQ